MIFGSTHFWPDREQISVIFWHDFDVVLKFEEHFDIR